MEIFLLRLDRIGDFVLGIPAYRALRKANPLDRISVVVPSDIVELAKACPYFDEVYIYDALWLKPGAKPLERWKSAWKLVEFLRSKKIDLVLNFRYQSRLDPLVTGLSGAQKRVGYDMGWVSRFLTQKVAQPMPNLHQIDRNLHLLQAIGITDTDRKLEIWTDEREKKVAENYMPGQEILPGMPRIAVHIGAATPSKRWREESFEVLIHELHAATQAEILVLGGEQDLGFSQEVLDGLECPVVNLVGKLSLLQMAALLEECQVFIGCDSGATHVAAASGVPVISLFSAANEVEVWKPWGPRVKVLTRNPECSPCKSYECLRTDGYFCMAEIKPEEVIAEVKLLLEMTRGEN
jgi:ADP-heptose:LPS heptosyltransferase